MKRSYIQAFLLTFLLVSIFHVVCCKQANSLPVGPELLGPDNDFKAIDNTSPRLEWDNISIFNDQIVSFKVKILKITLSGTDEEVLLGNEPLIVGKEMASYQAPICIFESKKRYKWTVCALDANNDEITKFSDPPKTFEMSNICPIRENTEDQDCDGIPDIVEKEVLGTSSTKKTLFVQPKKQKMGGGFEYWEEFIKLFPGDNRKGFAHIPQFSCPDNPQSFCPCNDIEVVVIGPIGPEGHHYDKFNHFDYNPDTTDDRLKSLGLPDGKLPCDIMEVELIMEEDTCCPNDLAECDNDYCICGNCKNLYQNEGHTSLKSIKTYIAGEETQVYTWRWDQKGFTPHLGGRHRYDIAQVFNFPLDMYFKEGAYYENIGMNQILITDNCKNNPEQNDPQQENKCDKFSPINLNDIDTLPNPPFEEIPDHDLDEDTVEFSPIVFYNSNGIDETGLTFETGQIKYIPKKIVFVKGLKIKPTTNAGPVIIEIEPYQTNQVIETEIEDQDTLSKSVFMDVSSDMAYIKPYTRDDVLRRTIVHEMGHALMGGGTEEHCSNKNCIMFKYTIDWEPQDFGPPCSKDENGNNQYCCKHKLCGSLDVHAAGRVYNTDRNEYE